MMTIDLLYSLSTSIFITFALGTYMYYLWCLSNGTDYRDMHPIMAIIQLAIRRAVFYVIDLIPQFTKTFGDIFDAAISK
jgi:hypothetical protein